MKNLFEKIHIKTTSGTDVVDITESVSKVTLRSGIIEGLATDSTPRL